MGNESLPNRARAYDPDDRPKFNEWVRIPLGSEESVGSHRVHTKLFYVVIALAASLLLGFGIGWYARNGNDYRTAGAPKFLHNRLDTGVRIPGKPSKVNYGAVRPTTTQKPSLGSIPPRYGSPTSTGAPPPSGTDTPGPIQTKRSPSISVGLAK